MDSRYLTFFIAGGQFCIPAERVIEINRNADYTFVPGASEAIKGILNLRGQLIVAFDMSRLLGIQSERNLRESVSIIVDVDSCHISLLVDSVGDILTLGPATFEKPPNNFPSHIRKAVIGAHKLIDQLLVIIDPYLFFQQLAVNAANPVPPEHSSLPL